MVQGEGKSDGGPTFLPEDFKAPPPNRSDPFGHYSHVRFSISLACVGMNCRVKGFPVVFSGEDDILTVAFQLNMYMLSFGILCHIDETFVNDPVK